MSVLRKRRITVTFEAITDDDETDALDVGRAVILGFNTWLVQQANEALREGRFDSKEVNAVRHGIDPIDVEAEWVGELGDEVEVHPRARAKFIQARAQDLLQEHLEREIRK